MDDNSFFIKQSFKRTVVNGAWSFPSLHEGSIETTLTVPLNYILIIVSDPAL